MRLFDWISKGSRGGLPNIKKLERKRDVLGLIDALSYRDPKDSFKSDSVNISAAQAIGNIGDKRAIGSLIEALHAEWFETSAAAALALGKIGDESAVEPLLKALTEDRRSDVNIASAMALIGLGAEKALDTIYKEIFCSGIEEKKRIIYFALETFPNEVKIKPLIEALFTEPADYPRYKDPQYIHQYLYPFAATELLKIGGDKGIQALIEALGHSYVNIRGNAARALGNGRVKAGVVPLIKALGDEDQWVRMLAAKALGHIGDSIAVEPLIEALQDDYLFARKEAAMALVEIGDKGAITVLEDFANRLGAGAYTKKVKEELRKLKR